MNLHCCLFSENKCTTSVFCIKDGFNTNMWCLSSIKIPKNCTFLVLTHHHLVQCHNSTLHHNPMYLVQLDTNQATKSRSLDMLGSFPLHPSFLSVSFLILSWNLWFHILKINDSCYIQNFESSPSDAGRPNWINA